MQPSIMKTDGGPHPADYYAGVAAAELIQIEASAVGSDVVQGRQLENKIIDILERYHNKILEEEEGKVISDPNRILLHPDPYDYDLNSCVKEIVDAGKASKWASAFSGGNVESVIRTVVGKHMSTAIHVTRSWHLDNNPTHKYFKEFHAKWNGRS